MGSDEAMEEDDRPKEGLTELVLPGSTAFDDCILPPLHNAYLYDDSRKSFLYSSACLINNATLRTRYAAFRAEKRKCGYTEKELEETFGFLLFDDENKATELGVRGLLAGHSTCSTLGDPSKGVYVSKYSDCLDLKPWYRGRSGHIAIVKLTKGRVKEVTENYTLKFTSPTPGCDSHESDQIRTVTAATSSFMAFERTQYYVYEVLNGGEETEKCPRHVYPFAIVAFSYGKAETVVPEVTQESDEKAAFDYKPWTGQLAFDSVVFDIGLKSHSGALIPTKLPTILSVKNAIRVPDLQALLPKEVFETCFSGDIFVGGKCCSLYEVISTDEDDSSLCLLIDELKEKDLALVFLLSDCGVFVMLHSSYFLSYEDASSEEIEALYGLFIFPDTHIIQKDTKSFQKKSALSSEIIQVLPALNYAETEVEKSGPDQHGEIRALFEQHLKNYGTLIQPGLQSSPQREASMFPDQYDVPCVFKHINPLPKWTEAAKLKVVMYLNDPFTFEIPVKRASELLRQQQNRDDPEDEVYYYISSPEEAPSSPVNSQGPETFLDPEENSPKDILVDTADDSSRPKENRDSMTSGAVTLHDLVEANTEESHQERATDAPLATEPDRVGSTDDLSPENDCGHCPENVPVSQPVRIEDHSNSDREDQFAAPLKRKKSLQGEEGNLIDNSVGVDSGTKMLTENSGQPDSPPASECMQPSPLAKDLTNAEEADIRSLCGHSDKPLEVGVGNSTTEVTKLSPSKLKLSPIVTEECCKATTEESENNQPVSEYAESSLEAEVSVLTYTPQGSEDAAAQEDRQSNMGKSSSQLNQASAKSKIFCQQDFEETSSKSPFDVQELQDGVDGVPIAALPCESPSHPEVLKEYNESESHSDKAHGILGVVEPEKPEAKGEVNSAIDTVTSTATSAETLIKDYSQDSPPSDQQPHEDLSISSLEENASSPLAVCTDKSSESNDNCPTATVPAVSCSSAVSSESMHGAESEDLCHSDAEKASCTLVKEETEKHQKAESDSHKGSLPARAGKDLKAEEVCFSEFTQTDKEAKRTSSGGDEIPETKEAYNPAGCLFEEMHAELKTAQSAVQVDLGKGGPVSSLTAITLPEGGPAEQEERGAFHMNVEDKAPLKPKKRLQRHGRKRRRRRIKSKASSKPQMTQSVSPLTLVPTETVQPFEQTHSAVSVAEEDSDSEFIQDDVSEDFCTSETADSPSTALIAESEKHVDADVNSPPDVGGVHSSVKKEEDLSSENLLPVNICKSNTDRTCQSEQSVCGEKSIQSQVTSVTSNLSEIVDLTLEVSEENSVLQEPPSVSDWPSGLSDVSPKPEMEKTVSQHPGAEKEKPPASEVGSLNAVTISEGGDSNAEALRKEHESEEAEAGKLNQPKNKVIRPGDSPALSLSASHHFSADEFRSEVIFAETCQPAQQGDLEKLGPVLVTRTDSPEECTASTSPLISVVVSTGLEKGHKVDKVVTELQPSTVAAEMTNKNEELQVSPKPCIPEEMGNDEPLGKEGTGASETNVGDRAPPKPDWRTRPWRRGRRRKRLLSAKPKTSSRRQIPQSVRPPTLVLTETADVGHEGKGQKLPLLQKDQLGLSKQDDILHVPTAEQVESTVKKCVPLECLEHNYSQYRKNTANQTPEVSTETKSHSKNDAKPLRRRKRRPRKLILQGDVQRLSGDEHSEEITVKSKPKKKRKLELDILNYDLRTVITDCGQVFVPHGSEMLPQDVELIKKRQKAAGSDKGLTGTRPEGLVAPAWSPKPLRHTPTGECPDNECLVPKDTKGSISPNVCQVTKTNNAAMHKETEVLIEGTEKNKSVLNSAEEPSIKEGADVSRATEPHRTTESDCKGPHKVRRKRSSTYTVIPITELRTVFRAGKMRSLAGSHSRKGLDHSGSEPNSKRIKGSGEDQNKTDIFFESTEESNTALVASGIVVDLQGLKPGPGICRELLLNEIVPSSEIASTSTKKYNTLLKKWQKINATDIFREQGATLQSTSSDPINVAKPEDLPGSNDGILVQIQLESVIEPNSEANGGKGGKPKKPSVVRPSSASKKLGVSSFRRQRKIVQKGETIEVSRQWKEIYNFSLDSKFIKNPHDETVSRALHGPWDSNIIDSEEEIHLIFHMWIGLFYSKSAPRFFHLDSNFSPPEEDTVGGAKSSEHIELQLPTSEFSKYAITDTPSDTSTVKAGPSRLVFEPLVLDPSDECLRASGLQLELQPERPSYEVLDLSLKGRRALDLTSIEDPMEVESISNPGGEQLCEDFEGPLDMRIEPVCEKADPTFQSSSTSEDTCSAEGAKEDYKNTTTDVICTSVNVSCSDSDSVKDQEDSLKTETGRPLDLSGKTKVDLFDRLREDQNPVITQDHNTKYRFFILVTSEDPFFKETKECLEADGHVAVEPDQFELDTNSPSSPLLIIMRNEDIAEYICEVPHLLDLKQSSNVVFAGIDRPDDIRNLTHEELFSKGGFVMFDGISLKNLSLESMKRTASLLEELGRKGKWKWYLHYRDSRGLREDARTSEDARDRKRFLDCCQEAGLVEVLPYHDCDVISQGRPDYLNCLVRLQVQNATRRYPVFITDSADEAFKKRGIFTLAENFGI